MSVVARPRKARVIAAIVAAVLLVVFTVAGLLMLRTHTGAYFGLSDQLAMIGIGVFLAAGALWFARPRVRADAEGVEVRNMAGARFFRWADVEGVSFPDGAPWARLEFANDEYVPLVAVQAIDGEHAVAAMRTLRRFRREAGERTAA
ncbi:PH domain-containing protein [Actinophytocola sediminis]